MDGHETVSLDREPTPRTPREQTRSTAVFRTLLGGLSATCALLLGLLIYVPPTLAEQATTPAAQAVSCDPGRDLLTPPEIKSENGLLKAELTLTGGKRTLWGYYGDTRCLPQDLRFFKGRSLLKNEPEDPAFSTGEPIPGPTLRARVGDLVQIRFLNQIDTQAFATSLDQANNSTSNTTGCDEVRTSTGQLYPGKTGDVMPNCLHGSSTSNIHFHGTHTTPNTTGDNVLLFIRPAMRTGGRLRPDAASVNRTFEQVFAACAKDGPPAKWQQMPLLWRAGQEALIKEYDRTAPYRGQPGQLPHDMQLWPVNEEEIAQGLWPQYQIGAYPYCFRLPEYKQDAAGKPTGVLMGQSPGTHWYHAHKHGSTALNVSNGMTGTLIIEGQYDDDLKRVYGQNFRQQVLMLQQLSTTPFPLLDPTRTGGPGAAKPQISVNGRLSPVVKMRPGEVQLWRVVNGAFRSAVQLNAFAPQGVSWRQIAQDGVQFNFQNYNTVGTVNAQLNLAPANRADFLVKAPMQTGRYTLQATTNEGIPLSPQAGIPPDKPNPFTLLTVSVEDAPVNPPMDFIQTEADFPKFPPFLADIPPSDVKHRRDVVFGAAHNLIDGEPFDPNTYNQVMLLNTAEEWKVSNQANDKAHPFHIHVNPFQIFEVFSPNSENTTDPTRPCYVDPTKPETWKPCKPINGPFVWWDTFAIPTATDPIDVTKACPGGTVDKCPQPIQQYTTCSGGTCSVTIPGYFRMRTRFVDFTGSYVLHCHILIHEDRGMMQLIEVVPTATPYIHK